MDGHSRPYDFAFLVPAYGEIIVARLVSAWERAFAPGGSETTEKNFQAFKRWMLFLADAGEREPHSAMGVVYKHLRDVPNELPDAIAYLDATAAFTAACHDPTDQSVTTARSNRARSGVVEALSSAMKGLARQGVFPKEHALRSLPRLKAADTKTASLAELSTEGRLDWRDEGAALSRVLEKPGFAEVLGIDVTALDALSMHERRNLFARINRERLAALRACAVQDLMAERNAKIEGDAAIARTDLPRPGQVEASLYSTSRGGWTPVTMLRNLEGRQDSGGDHGWQDRLRTILVHYLSIQHDGCFEYGHLHHRLQVAISAVGGLHEIIRRLEGTSVALTAAFVIVLIDTGMNHGTCLSLHAEPFTSHVVRRRRRISTIEAVKMRAGGNVIRADLIDEQEGYIDGVSEKGHVSGTEAIQIWQWLSLRPRDRARLHSTGSEDLLWIVSAGIGNHNPVLLISDGSWNNWLGAFLRRHRDNPLIGELPITARSIRTTVLQLHTDRGGLEQVLRAMGQHKSSAVGAQYRNTVIRRRQLADAIRSFQDLFEAAASSDIDDVAALLELSPDELLTRRTLAMQTGLGFLCMNNLAGARPGTTPGKPCDRLNECPDCVLCKFVPYEEGLQALFLTHRALKDAQEEYEAANPARWYHVWLPYLALCMATIERLGKGPYRLRWEKASIATLAKLERGQVVVPRLW